MGGGHRRPGLRPGFVELVPQPVQLALELEHPAHPFEVQPGRRQLLDVAQTGQVGVGEAAAPAAGPRGIQQALALVDAQGLRVHPVSSAATEIT